MRGRSKSLGLWLNLLMLLWSAVGLLPEAPRVQAAANGPVMMITINGPITPATDDFLRSALEEAHAQSARLFVLKLNTPGGLLTSMQKMVESLLEAPVPTVVYVSPSGGAAVSAGVFITLAGHVAVMAPGTTIGAAHPVLSGGGDVQGDMREKIENFTVSLIKAISEQRGRNVKWAELAVRESVSITDREAVSEGVVDLVASDLDKLLTEIEGRTVNVRGTPVTLQGLVSAPRTEIDMSLRQRLVSVLSDPNIAVLLGLGALVGIGIELYHPGAVLPGVVGAICLILSLIAGQTLPISYGGLALLALGAVFFMVEMTMPSFGIWGVSGIVCLVLGSIYFVDARMVWSSNEFGINRILIGTIAGFAGILMLVVCYLALETRSRKVSTGREGLLGKEATTVRDFTSDVSGQNVGKVEVMGEYWNARSEGALPVRGQRVTIIAVEPGMVLLVAPPGEKQQQQ